MVFAREMISRDLFQCLGHLKLSKILIILCLILLLIPLMTHYYLSNVENSSLRITHSAHSHAGLEDELGIISNLDMRGRVDELARIKSATVKYPDPLLFR